MQHSPKNKDCRYCIICKEPVMRFHKLKVIKVGAFGFQEVKEEILKPVKWTPKGWMCLECQQED